MAHKEFRIPFSEISDSQTITGRISKEFKSQGLDVRKNEAVDVIDDFKKKERIIKARNMKFFTVGDIPWHKR